MAVTHATILAIDQGTTSTRAILFDRDGTVLRAAQRALPQIYPAMAGWSMIRRSFGPTRSPRAGR